MFLMDRRHSLIRIERRINDTRTLNRLIKKRELRTAGHHYAYRSENFVAETKASRE
ncbi:hypothetical protein Hanom_Chr03g00254771 [Helianthus anomalus]